MYFYFPGDLQVTTMNVPGLFGNKNTSLSEFLRQQTMVPILEHVILTLESKFIFSICFATLIFFVAFGLFIVPVVHKWIKIPLNTPYLLILLLDLESS